MTESFANLRKELNALAENFQQLGARLAENARGMREELSPPDEALVEQITGACRAFSVLRDSVIETAHSPSLPPLAEARLNGNAASLRGLEGVIERMERKHAELMELQRRAIGLLDEVGRLKYRGQGDLPELRDCQDRALALRKRLTAAFTAELLPEINAIANRETTFADLLDLVGGGETLDDDRATSLSFKVEGAFGRRLVVAALRGQIGFVDPPPPLDEPPAPPSSTPPSDTSPSAAPPPAGPSTPPPASAAPSVPSTSSTGPSAVTTRLDNQDWQHRPESASELAAELASELATLASELATELSPQTVEPRSEPAGAPNPLASFNFFPIVPIELIEPFEPIEISATLPAVADDNEPLTSPETMHIEAIAVEADEELPASISGGAGSGGAGEAVWMEEEADQRQYGRVNGKIRITEDLVSPAFAFNNSSAREIASSLLRTEKSFQPESLSTLLWQMLAESRLGLAYHLSSVMERVYPDLPYHLPARLIRPLATGRHIRFDLGEIALSLERDLSHFDEAFFEKLDNDPNQEWGLAVNLLLLASVLRPALLAPSTQAESVLASVRLSKGLDAFATYCRAIFDFTVYRQPFDPRLLAHAPNPAVQQAEMDELIRRVKAWFARASRLDLKDAAAQKVWTGWLGGQGRIGSLLQPVIQNDLRRLAAVKSETATLADETAIEAAIRQSLTDSPAAIEQIRKLTREALDFAQHWTDAQQSALRQQREEPFTRTRELSATLTELRDDAIENLESFKRGERSLFANCGAQLCLRAVNDLDRLLAGAEEAGPEPSVREILNADLLHIPEIPLDIRWEPDGVEDQRILRGVAETIAETRFDWQKAYEKRAERQDHEATMRIIEHLSTMRNPGNRLNDLIAERDTQLRQCRESLQAATDTVRQKIEAAVIADWLDEKQRVQFLARLDRIDRLIPGCLRFFEENEALQNLNLDLESHCARMRVETEGRLNREIETLRQRVESLRSNLKDSDYERILAALEGSEVALADRYLRLAVKGEELPVTGQEAFHLKAFFPNGLKTLATLSNSILAGGNLADDARNLLPDGSLSDGLLRAVDAWDAAKQAGKPDDDGLRAILGFLGFRLLGVESYHTRTPGDLLVRMSPEDETCRIPTPKYGSGAQQQYRVLCLTEDQTAEEIAAIVKNTVDNKPLIVFYFGSLIEEQRRQLARHSNENRLIFLVLDDLLLLHLCKLPAPRTAAFFHCTLPFSFSNPYNPDHPAPPEMFFGREAELAQLLDLKGAAFVYGARRIGKTSLLLEGKRRFDRKGARGDWERLALYLDLNEENIGAERPLDFLWKKLSDLLIEAGSFPEASRQTIGASLLLGLVRKWLDADENRKLLILLDDADLFLRLDAAEGFARCTRLKALMDEPGYRHRFKLVFAGGAVTLRATQIGNPLQAPAGAQASRLRLEAFHHNRENVPAAIQLIEMVFASIGYEFESPELIMQILSLTDYHPNLIHLHCQHLIKHVTGSRAPAFAHESCPPYVIKAAHLHEAFQSAGSNADLMMRMRASLTATLEMDRRHLVIAQLLASRLASLAGPPDDAGFDAAWIRRHAAALWPEGFHSSHSIFDIRALLDEMTELGFLRMSEGRYHVQSPQLLARLGTREELETALANSNKLLPSPVFEAAFQRTAYSSHVSRRSPLTVRQFQTLRKRESGVSILFGSKALELDIADLFLSHALPQEFTCMNKYASRGDFVRTIAELRQKPPGSLQIFFIPADCLWDEEWMAEAIRSLDRMSGLDKCIRIVFAADPMKTWRWLALDPARRAALNLHRVQPLFSLTPWHDSFLRTWLDDLGIQADEHQRSEVASVTGNYPILLDKFYKAACADLRDWTPCLQKMKNSFHESREELGLALGLHLTEPAIALRQLARLGRASAENLAADTGLAPELIRASLEWADLLGYAQPVVSPVASSVASGEIEWQLTPLLNRLLTEQPTAST